jgi:arylsulfatase A-like enzyme
MPWPARLLVVAAALAVAGCQRFHGPLHLLDQAAQGAAPKVAQLELAGDKRRALLSPARYEVTLPARGLLTLGMGIAQAQGGTEPPGWYRLSVRSGDRVLLERQLNPRELRGWRDVSVELPDLGRRATLEIDFRLTERDGRDLTPPPGLVLAVADPIVHDLDDYGRERGIVLISIDTLRRDHVGAYGYAKPTTPTLDRLAASGILVDDAVSTSSWTLPAHLSMMTSADPGAHGGTNRDVGYNRCPPTLASLLRTAGYATQAVTSWLYVSSVYGLDAGFDHMEYNQKHRAPEVASRGIDLLDRFGDRPFFVFLHFYDPHTHYDPHESTTHLFEKDYKGTLTGNWDGFKDILPEKMAPADMAHLLALYDGEIRFTDDEVARVVEHLQKRGLDKGTLVIVTSDHGEEFGEHGSWEHQKTLYEEVIRVPLIIRGPDISPRREMAPASLLDVAPTIVAWAGLKPQWKPQGQSLLRAPGPRVLYGETDHTLDRTRKLFVRDGAGGGKTILSLSQDASAIAAQEWYDLRRDPRETHSTPPREDAAEARRSEALSRWREDRRECGASPSVTFTKEQRESLRALGYIP